MSEKVITHLDIENKQLIEENKKLNVNENENENENVTFFQKIVKDANIKE